jgi:putative ABC transport system substrate-binding protein
VKRRDFIRGIIGSVAAWPLTGRAQGERIRRIGVIIGYAENDPATIARLTAFRRGLARRGWLEERNIQIESRFAAGEAAQFTALAKDMLARGPEVILAHTTPVAVALRRETHEIPIVFVNVSDPIGAGLIDNLARPGGNVTGVMHYEPGIVSKWLGMLKEIAPRIARAEIIGNPKTTPYGYFLRAAQAAAPTLGLEIVASPVENSAADIERAFDVFGRNADSGLVVLPDSTTVQHRSLIIALAVRHRLPAVYPFVLFVEAGGLMSYGTDQVDMFRLAAYYVDRTLRGDKPADLPVQSPTKFETAVNTKAAKAIGLTVPSGLLVAADEVIE